MFGSNLYKLWKQSQEIEVNGGLWLPGARYPHHPMRYMSYKQKVESMSVTCLGDKRSYPAPVCVPV